MKPIFRFPEMIVSRQYLESRCVIKGRVEGLDLPVFEIEDRGMTKYALATSEKGEEFCHVTNVGPLIEHDLEFLSSFLDQRLHQAYWLEEQGQCRTASTRLIDFIVRNVARGDWQPLEELLQTVEIDKLSDHFLSVLVRYTSQHREHLPSWDDFYREVFCLLSLREADTGISPRQLLIGIPAPKT